MLTPDYLSLIEFNDVVKLYEQLNIDITADIIKRVSQMQEITSTTKEQLKILLQTNGTEVFNETLQKTAMLTADTKKALKELYTDVAKEDIQSYKELYEYRNKPFKLSETQYKILNEGLKTTNKTLKNLTNSIAFQSKQTYIQAVNRAYMQVATGAIDYNSAINTTVKELAKKGVTLQDKLGRNVQLEVAVRRNVLSGIHETSNRMNRDIEDYLGCDGYEVTAHMGARPGHAEAQGKQYAINHNTKESQKYPLWKDVEDLWQEYNCRHTYFGIILGVSEPQYLDKELNEFKNATVKLNGKEIPYYEATQKQRQYENSIRKTKRSIQTLEKAEQDTTAEKIQLKQLQKQLTNFTNETGLQKDYSRTKVTAISKEIKNTQTKYEDITNNYVKIKQYSVKEQKYYEDDNKKKYKVDGKNVIIKANKKEREIADLMGEIYGGKVKLVPVVLNPQGIKTPDYIINGEKFDLKEVFGNGKNTLDTAISKKKNQSSNFIFDISKTKMNSKEALNQIERIYKSSNRTWVNKIVLIKNGKLLKILKRQ